MITYEYECKECGETFDVQQSIKDDPYVICPACGEHALVRILHAPLHVRVIGGDPTTVGQLAERNSKHMSAEEMDRVRKSYETQKTINRIPDEHLPAQQPAKPTEALPDFMEKARSKTTKEVVKMTPTQTKKYIQTGE